MNEMKEKTIEKKILAEFIDSLLKKYEVFAPIEEDNLLHFRKISSSDQVCVDSPRLERSAKELFFPQCETLFTYHSNNQSRTIEEPPPLKEERVLFFTRPCDAKALTLIDKVFTSWKPEDTPYTDRREKTIIVGRACSHPWNTCFCTSLGGDPFGKEGMDLIFEEINEKYVVEPVTERGEKLIEKNPLFKDAKDTDLKKLKEISAKAVNTLGPKLDVDGVDKKLAAIYDDELWDTISQKCVGCGVCTFLCPVCHCFDVLDEGTELEGRRVRIWDACQFPLFTLHASGHNPRPSRIERMRQRMMHKFRYFSDNLEGFACVGCGRCIRECPVNMDIREVLRKIVDKKVD